MKTNLQNKSIIQELRLIKGKFVLQPFLDCITSSLMTLKRQNKLFRHEKQEPEKEKKNHIRDCKSTIDKRLKKKKDLF